MNTRNYCTLFDKNYLDKGLALHASLLRHSSEPFVLYVLAMDHETFQILDELKLSKVKLLPLEHFETALNMQSVRESRSLVEYFWTCASSLCEYLMLHIPDLDAITYLDADLFFFSDPKVIFDEIGERSIAIIPHRFSPAEQVRLGKNGDFNVGIVVARNTEIGRACIARWAAQCRERCSIGFGCGDQLYLNEWPELYGSECCAIQNLGINLGPWSLDHLHVTQNGGATLISRNDEAPYFELSSFHFHGFMDHKHVTGYQLRQIHIDLIYLPYIAAWTDAKERIRIVDEKVRQRSLEAKHQWEMA